MIESPRVLDVAPILTAVIRERVPARELSRFVPAACGEVWNFLKAAGLKGGRHVALYGGPQGMVEVGAEVTQAFEGTERVQCSQLPGGRVVTVTHYGPYGGLGAAHGAIHSWLKEQGKEPKISWEIYGHWEESWNAEPEKIRTDVFYLLAGA